MSFFKLKSFHFHRFECYATMPMLTFRAWATCDCAAMPMLVFQPWVTCGYCCHMLIIDVKYGCFFTFACLVNRTKKGFLVGHRPIKSPHGIGSLIGPNVFYFYK